MSDNGEYVVQVTLAKGEGWNVAVGEQFEIPGLDDSTKLKVVGEMLINLGTRLMGSSVGDEIDDEEFEDDEYDD